MKQFRLSLTHCSLLIAILILLFANSKKVDAQTLPISNYVLFSGAGGAGTTTPPSPGYGVHLGSPCIVVNGSVGSNRLVKTSGSGNFGGNINSGGTIILSGSNTVSGKITAANSYSSTGTILSIGTGANLSGNIDVNGNVVVSSGTVSGKVTHPVGTTYTGPIPGGGNVTGAPTLPTLPSLPTPMVFPSAGITNITTSTTLTPGAYGNVALSNNQVLTLNGPGVYVFNSINNGNNCSFVYNFNNTSSGDFLIYVHQDVYLGKFSGVIANGGGANRIYCEIHGTGSVGGNAITINNGTASSHTKWLGTVYAPYAAINFGSGGNTDVSGCFWSGTQVVISGGLALNYVPFGPACTPPVANAGIDKNFCSGGSTSIGVAAVAGNTYSWSPSIGLGSSTVSNPTVSSAIAGTTTYTLTVSSGTCSSTDQVIVSVNALPSVSAGTAFTKTCSTNSSGTFIGETAVSGFSYSWSPAAGLSSSTVSKPIANPSITTTYTVTKTNNLSLCSATSTVVVTVNNTPITVSAGTAFTKTCTSNSNGAAIGEINVSGNTYNWSPSAGLSATNISNPLANPSASTTYTVTKSNTSSGCSATASVVVTVNSVTPNANAGFDNAITCFYVTAKLKGSSTTPNAQFNWSTTTGNIVADGNTFSPTVNAVGD